MLRRVPACTGLVAVIFSLAGAPAVRADALSAAQVLRAGGCGGLVPIAAPLRRNAQLDRAAARWAAGAALSEATGRSGLAAGSAAGVHVIGPERGLLERLRRSDCPTITRASFDTVGFYQRGAESWLVLAGAMTPGAVTSGPGTSGPATPRAVTASAVPPGVHWSTARPLQAGRPPSAGISARALQLVNEVRARGTQCGSRTFSPAPPLTLSGTLAGVAFGHAADMAEHNYFEHEDLTGQSPADRVRAVGYREKLVGENIAYGPKTVEEVVRGWLDSPGHCENIMDPRFAQMGIADAAGQATRRGLYWVQVLAEPRT